MVDTKEAAAKDTESAPKNLKPEGEAEGEGETEPKPKPSTEDPKDVDTAPAPAPNLTPAALSLNDSSREEEEEKEKESHPDNTQSSADVTDINAATAHPHDAVADAANANNNDAAAQDFIKSEEKEKEEDAVDNNINGNSNNKDPDDEPNTDAADVKHLSSATPKDDDEAFNHNESSSQRKAEDDNNEGEEDDVVAPTAIKKEVPKPPKLDVSLALNTPPLATLTPIKSFLLDSSADGYESGTDQEQAAFMKDVESFHKQNHLEFKPPKFYKEELNLLKLWRLVIKLGGYEQALLEYEKNKLKNGELPFSDGPLTESIRAESQVKGLRMMDWKSVTAVFLFFENNYDQTSCNLGLTSSYSMRDAIEIFIQEIELLIKSMRDILHADDMMKAGGSQALGSGRARRDAAARAMQGWHSQRLLGNGEDKNLSTTPKGDKQLKTNGLLKRKRLSPVEGAVHFGHKKAMKSQGDAMVIDVGPPADWVKINVQKTNDCFEIYALVPGLLREEVHVQSDPAGRLIISGQPEHLDNPWGVTPFKKVVSLPIRIDPHQTSAVVTLHGQLFVRVPFEPSDL
ncbi:unnamed protein product [Dovyalis caffra]|uniref:Uncharacterized protein n=1 Tax=Dovyalis caffra TaxID=77055 RepID=A0AAV1R973_9ROSI|nr:unnamed protein product [Dovyalis caffra]